VPDKRVTLREASVLLGVSEGAIRKRVARGTIRSEKGDDGLRYVWVDAGTDEGEDASYTAGSDRELLYEEMRERIAYLERQVEEEREARRRADTLLARLMDSVPALEPPADAPAPAQASEEPAEGAADSVAGVRVAQADTGAQNATERPWWKFWS